MPRLRAATSALALVLLGASCGADGNDASPLTTVPAPSEVVLTPDEVTAGSDSSSTTNVPSSPAPSTPTPAPTAVPASTPAITTLPSTSVPVTTTTNTPQSSPTTSTPPDDAPDAVGPDEADGVADDARPEDEPASSSEGAATSERAAPSDRREGFCAALVPRVGDAAMPIGLDEVREVAEAFVYDRLGGADAGLCRTVDAAAAYVDVENDGAGCLVRCSGWEVISATFGEITRTGTTVELTYEGSGGERWSLTEVLEVMVTATDGGDVALIDSIEVGDVQPLAGA